ncbi:MAG TPA: M36 family metallopeptidase [Bryobacteraceae bacterium]|nr:M36 family metallopeptidase [Bryobacteraceae bacterium]
MGQRVIAVFLLLLPAGFNAAGQVRQVRRGVSDVDLRDNEAGPAARPPAARVRAQAVVTQRNAAIAQFVAARQADLPGLRISMNRYGLPKVFLRDGLPLTPASTADPEVIARGFIRQNSRVYPFAASEVDRLRVTVRDVTPTATYLAFIQTINGFDVFEGQIKFTLSRTGEVIQTSAGEVIPGVSVVTQASLRPEEAEQLARDGVSGKAGQTGGQFIRAAETVIFPLDSSTGRLAYRLFFEADGEHLYEILIDALDGTLLYRHNTTVYAAQGRIWKQSPLIGTRDLVDFPAAWLPDTATVTTGNNVDAWIDSNGDDRPDTTEVADILSGRVSSPARVFDFPFGDGTTAANPRNFKASAVTNLFYFVNTAHDYYYDLGFTETAGNFQTDNFGKGGKGGDPVIAEAQQGGSANNASFSPTPEGTQARMRIGIFTRSTTSLTDDLDGDLDGQVVVHEYGHGVSNRLVGALTSTSCLSRIQSGAMGEGWSDYFAMSFFNNPVMGIQRRPTHERGAASKL